MKDFLTPLAILLIGIGLWMGPSTELPSIPDWINPVNWINKGPVTALIVEETADRMKLPASQITILTSITLAPAVKDAGGTFLGCVDKDIMDRDKKVPVELSPYLDAAKKVGTPALVYKRGNRYTAIALPLDEKTLLERLK